ncbi:NUDIX hydrolase [Sphingobacterium multivorum]|uniref:NUDIX hydrolase n=1 Tax=Sphingobacterium multivorum TaxID=28454 RepID=UPI000ECB0BA9|nr:NUDIX hydrolase [Sphingobacterium multivorum]HCX58139.1 DNA mismatch repair protein MutT [Sphingobacterium sp.]
MEKWKLLSSAYICKEPWATLRRDTCELPDGRINDHYYVLEYPDWVNMIGITEQNELLVIKQYRHGAGIIALEIPAGTTEAGEDPKNAAVREMLEETGYQFDQIEEIAALYANPATSGNITYSYLMTGGKKVQEQDLDEHEEIDVYRIPLEEAKSMLLDNKFSQALHASALFYAFNKLGLL